MAAISAVSVPRAWRVWLVVIAFFFIFGSLLHQKPEYVEHGKNLVKAYGPKYLPGNIVQPKYWDDGGKKTHTFPSDAQRPERISGEARQFWTEYSQIITESDFSFREVRLRDDVEGWPIVHFQSVTMWDSRLDRLNVTEDEINELKEKHTTTATRLKEIAPRLPFVPGTRGIAVTTAVDAMAFLTVSLRMLRKTGTTLPVEIIVYSRQNWGWDPYGLHMCEDVWGPLGATCIWVEDYLPDPKPAPYDKESVKYQNKLDAMMFSSFEEVLFLDSDNNVVAPVDELFVQEPFKSHGFVLWPDYWADTSSKYFYEISGVEEEPVYKRSSTESGQVMINKNTHSAALLMASYYVRYGDKFFRLLTQDAMGMGDKETYLKACKAVGLPFYQVNEPPERMGYRCNGERATASGQHHPGDDYFMSSLGIRRGGRLDLLADGTTPRVIFIHGNLPKLDPQQYLDWYNKMTWDDQLRCDHGEGEAHRMFGDSRLTTLKFGWDIEKALWDQMRWASCETEQYQVQWWNGTWQKNWAKRLNVCRDFVSFYDELLGPEGLKYDDALTNPYAEGGEYYQNMVNGFTGGWGKFPWRWQSTLDLSGKPSNSATGSTSTVNSESEDSPEQNESSDTTEAEKRKRKVR